jgi:hypothetical protein
MGLLLLCLVVAAIFGFIGYLDKYDERGYNWTKLIGRSIGGFCLGLLFIGIFGGMFASFESGTYMHPEGKGCEERLHSTSIISTTREKQLSGSFILGTGGVSSVERYYVYVEHEHGFKLTKFRTDNTYIVETDGQPRYERTDYACVASFYNFLYYPKTKIGITKGKWGQLYVPKDTILREFEL